MKKSSLIISVILLWTHHAFSQDISFSNLKIDTITGINWTSINYEELRPIANILSKHDLLILSESDHGDGSSIEAETMILKSLIDSGRINTLYLECSYMVLDKISEVLYKYGKDSIRNVVNYMRTGNLLYWAGNGFWDYLAEKIIDKKIKLYGFDISGPSERIVNEMVKEAMLIEPVLNIKAKNRPAYDDFFLALTNFDTWGSQSFFTKNSYYNRSKLTKPIMDYYYQKNDFARFRQWKGLDQFFYWCHERSRVTEVNKVENVIKNDLQFSSFNSARDKMMAENFFYYYDKNENQKAVAIMSCYHSVKKTNLIEGYSKCCKPDAVFILGELIDQKLGDKAYNICFLKSTGLFGVSTKSSNLPPMEVKKTKKGSLENWLSKQSFEYSFIDLKNSALKNETFFMGPVFYRYLESNWARNFSGVFYIKEMKPLFINMEY